MNKNDDEVLSAMGIVEDERDNNNNYSNTVALAFKKWSNRVSILGIIILILLIITSIIMQNIYVFIGSIVLYAVLVANSLILLAVAEIIQKLQNIENNTRK